MNAISWKEAQSVWFVDGSLRDVYIKHTNIEDWQSFLDWIEPKHYRYEFNGEEQELPQAKDIFVNSDGAHLLKIQIGKINIHCYFFVEYEIELDIDPKEIKEEKDQEQVFRFIENLANHINKSAMITPENMDYIPIMTYEISDNVWVINEGDESW